MQLDRMYNFSIIIPHFNIPELLLRCLDSIPVRDDVQIIVVDDCSPNAETYAERFPVLLSRPHLEFYSTTKGGGGGCARNVGLEHASGKWLLFADADDFFCAEMSQILDDYIDAEEDIIYFRKKSVWSDDVTKESNRSVWNEYLYKLYDETGNTTIFRLHYPTPWGKIIRREMVETYDIRFEEIRYSNDVVFSAACNCHARSVSVDDRILYVVTARHNSIASSLFEQDKTCNNKELEIRTDACLRAHLLYLDHGLLPIEKDDFLSIYYYLDRWFVTSPWRYCQYLRTLRKHHCSVRSVWQANYLKCKGKQKKLKFLIFTILGCVG